MADGAAACIDSTFGIFNYTRRIDYPAASSVQFPGAGLPVITFVPRKNDEMMFTYAISTLYWHGHLSPAVFGAYDLRGVNAVVPALTYQIGTNTQVTLKYAVIAVTFADLGFFRDRDELLLRLQYNLS